MAASLMSSAPLALAKPTPFPTGPHASSARLPFAPTLRVVPLKARSGAVRCAAKDDFREGVQKNVEGTVERAQETLSNAGDAIKGAVGGGADRAEGARARVAEEGQGVLEETHERGQQAVEELREKLKENTEGARHKGEEIGSQVGDAIDGLKEKAGDARDAAGEKIEGAVDSIKGQADRARNQATAVVEEFTWAWAALNAGTALAAALGCAVVLTAQPSLAATITPNPQFEVARSWFDNLVLSGRVQKDKPAYGESVGTQKNELRQKPEGRLESGLESVVRNVDTNSQGPQGNIREADRRAKGAVGGAVREVDRRSKGAFGDAAREADRRSGGAVEGLKRGAGEAASRVEREGKGVLDQGREALQRAGASFQESSLPAPLTKAIASVEGAKATGSERSIPTLPPRAAIRGRSDAVQGKDQKEIREVQAKIPKALQGSSKGPFATLPSKSDVDQSVGSAKGKVESAAQSLQGQSSGVVNSIKGAVNDAQQSVGLDGSGAAAGLKERAQNLISNTNAKNQQIGADVKDRAVKAKDTIVEQTKDALGGFSVYPTSSGTYAFNFNPQKAAKEASDNVSDAVKGVQAQGQGMGKEAQGSVQSATDNAKSGGDNLADTLQRSTGEAIDFLKGKAKATAEEGPKELAKAAGSGSTSPDLGKKADNTDRGSYESADNLAKEESKFSTNSGGFEPNRLLQQEKEGRIL